MQWVVVVNCEKNILVTYCYTSLIGSLFLVAGLRVCERELCGVVSSLLCVWLCMIHILMPFLYNVGSISRVLAYTVHSTICKCDNGVPMTPSPSVMAWLFPVSVKHTHHYFRNNCCFWTTALFCSRILQRSVNVIMVLRQENRTPQMGGSLHAKDCCTFCLCGSG